MRAGLACVLAALLAAAPAPADCVDCDPARAKTAAHPNPQVHIDAPADEGCDGCHPGYAERWAKSIMATESGDVERGLCAAGWRQRQARADGPRIYGRYAITDEDGAVPTVGTAAYRSLMRERVAALPALYPRALHAVPPSVAGVQAGNSDCGACHRGRDAPPGCSVCHTAHASDTAANPSAESRSAPAPDKCLECHFDPRATARNDIGDALVHFGSRKAGEGLWCRDCHTSIEMHGDGNIHATAAAQLEIRCEDCHGTLDRLPWELPLASADDSVERGPPRGLADAEGAPIGSRDARPAYLLTSRGNPIGNVVRSGDGVFLHSASGHVAEVSLLALLPERAEELSERARQVKLAPALHAGMACMDCHADWLPPCIGCHAEPQAPGEPVSR